MPFSVCLTGTAMVVRPRLNAAIEKTSGSPNPSGSATVTLSICTSSSTFASSGSSKLDRWFGYSTLSISRTKASV